MPYKQTPGFTETSVPAALLKAHSTKAGVWARIHVEEGQLRFRDLETGAATTLTVGVFRLIYPQALHQVELIGSVRFSVEFCRPAA